MQKVEIVFSENPLQNLWRQVYEIKLSRTLMECFGANFV